MFDLFKKDKSSKFSEIDTIIQKIKLDTGYFEKIPDKYKNNKSVISTLLKKEDFKYKNLSENDRNNKNLYRKIVSIQKNGYLLRYAGDNVKSDFNSILISVYFNPCSIDYVKRIEDVSKLEVEELLFWLINKDDRLFNFIHKDILDVINLSEEKLKNLNLDIKKIQSKYDCKLGINNELSLKDKINDKNKEKFNLNIALKN